MKRKDTEWTGKVKKVVYVIDTKDHNTGQWWTFSTIGEIPVMFGTRKSATKTITQQRLWDPKYRMRVRRAVMTLDFNAPR